MKIKFETIVLGVSLILTGFILNNALTIGNLNDKNLSNESDIRSQLKKEFNNSYTENINQSGTVEEINLIASEGEVEIFKENKTKTWNYNGQVPGPEIRIKLGDTLRVNFKNDLPQETTIHWHGVRVPNAMDGVPGVTQEPIQPGKSFVYEFTPKDAGTFWFHPHVRTSEQIERGLYGVLIVEDEYSDQYSQDITWVIDDWRLIDNYQINPNFNTIHDLAHDGRWGNVITVNGLLNEKLNVKPGERIRLRLINVSNARIYKPYLLGLNAKIIAVDGLYTKRPIAADGFELSPGNRIDIDITIPSEKSKASYEVADFYTRNSSQLGLINVSGNPVDTPSFDFPSNANVPDWKEAIKLSTDKEFRLNAKSGTNSMGMGMMGGIEWTINGKAFPDYDPFELKYNEFNKIRFVNESSRLHPMHLHGQFFKVISRNGQPVDEPYFRDTVLVHSKETIELGLLPLDKGSWVQHCHILEHAEAGMLTIIKVQ